MHTNFDHWWTLGGSSFLAFCLSLSLVSQTLQLGLLRLRSVFVQQTKQLRGRLSVEQIAAELIQSRRHLQALVQDRATSLNAHISGPFKEAREITLGLDVTT